MALDRDISVSVAKALSERLGPARWSAWEMLSATGVRSLRVLNESRLLDSLVLTEANRSAFQVLSANADLYRDRGAHALLQDARTPPHGSPFDLVDLDPYGSPLEFFEPLFHATHYGSVAAITATDLRVLAGADPSACERRYGAVPLRGRLAPEGGLRILLGSLARTAHSNGRALRPLLAYVQGHYLRAYVEFVPPGDPGSMPVATIDPRTFDGPALGRPGVVGPMWTGSLLDASFVHRLEVPAGSARPRELTRLLELWKDEAGVPALFYFEANELARPLRLPSPPRVNLMIEELRRSGWLAARTHVRAGGFRTTAPRSEVERIARLVSGRNNVG